MATVVNLKNDNNVVREGVVGFSWTTFFFGFFVPVIRGDWKWFFIMLVTNIFTFGLINLVFCFIYNKIYTRGLLEKGFFPADDYSKQLLVQAGLVSN